AQRRDQRQEWAKGRNVCSRALTSCAAMRVPCAEPGLGKVEGRLGLASPPNRKRPRAVARTVNTTQLLPDRRTRRQDFAEELTTSSACVQSAKSSGSGCRDCPACSSASARSESIAASKSSRESKP